MGSYSRMVRASRFIEEFNADFQKKLTPTFNEKFVSAGLGVLEPYGSVVFWVRILDANENEHEYTDGSIIFDPDLLIGDAIERLRDFFDEDEISDDELKARLVKAGLD